MKAHIYLLLAVLIIETKMCQTQFQLKPENKIISTSESQDRYVIFSCQHDTADILSWEVNEEGLSDNDMNRDITTGLFSISYYNRTYVQQLKIPTNPQYNETTVECIATFFDGSPEQKTESVSLIFQDNAMPLPTDFAQVPYTFGRELILALGENSTFTCQHCLTNNIEWIINETKIANGLFPDGVMLYYSVQGNCGLQFALSIDIDIQNTTSIQCKANVDGTTHNTAPFILRVQGPLAPVVHLTRQYARNQGVQFNWERPFSLDVTHADPDIIYCINIYLTNCIYSSHDIVIQDCSVTNEGYTSIATLIENQLYQVEVQPKTNLEVARNETSFTVHKDTFVYFDNDAVTFDTNFQEEAVQITVKLKLTDINNGVTPSRLSLEMAPIDISESDTFICLALLNTSVPHMEEYASTFNCFVLIERRRIYSGTLFVDIPTPECQVANTVELSTHIIKNIQVTVHQPGEVLVSADFVNTSNIITANGFIAILYTDSDPDLHYGIATRSPDELYAEVIVSGLLEDEYRVSLFSIEADGLPFIRSAASAMNINVSSGNMTIADTNITDSITANVSRQADCITLTCTFNDSESEDSATECVAIIANKTEISLTLGLSNVGIYSFTRIGLTADGCLPEVNISDQWIYVFAYRDNMLIGAPISISEIINDDNQIDLPTEGRPTDMNDEKPDITQAVYIVIPFIVIITPVLVAIIIIIACYRLLKKKRFIAIDLQQVNDEGQNSSQSTELKKYMSREWWQELVAKTEQVS